MAPPPKYMITRRLIGRYMKSFVPVQADQSRMFEVELFNCWKTFGIDSDKCNHIMKKVENYAGVNVSQAARENAQRLATEIKSELNKPLYSFHKKGRYRDFAPRTFNIYDGII
jgi:hypothetical protein